MVEFEASVYQSLPSTYLPTHPMTSGDLLALAALAVMVALAIVFALRAHGNAAEGGSAPGWWGSDWDADERPWPGGPQSGDDSAVTRRNAITRSDRLRE